MDLAQYKKAWENQPEEKNKVSALEIYKMTQTKSTSIAKWIFIIGLAEFAFWLILNFIFSGLEEVKIYEELNLMGYVNFAYYFNIAIVVVFLIVFYKNLLFSFKHRQHQNTHAEDYSCSKDCKILCCL